MPDSLPVGQSAVVGVGTDILQVERIGLVFRRNGERLVTRILTPAEQALWRQRGGTVNFLAKQFAAKEALAKALGTGIAKGVGFQQLEVLRSAAGAPRVSLYGAAADRLQQLGGKQAWVSLSDEEALVLAFAVLSR
ncbi:holo-ACP synthase [Oceanobacter sp. 3_MG-2023]|uniref:holo-ACP synthase n=1 Tax=Oceanobacter sp. 3_MG-2023 TaxID=3062622 RepID=UPI0027372643|nr:holo-ACP synthase [Oceanobacter sp. 3_MG-2023]MDP2506796.1 holo-ACP synthase [Oceanobacter sp. 3_MG-2023]